MAANDVVLGTKNVTKKWNGGFASAVRIQQSLTAPLERRILRWLAARTPAWISSDHLTALGLFGQCAAGAGYALARGNKYWLSLAIVAIAVNWLGDSLDGTLARFRNQQRPRYGFYVDHVCDVFGAMFLMLGLALSGFCDWRIAIGMLLAFLLMCAETYLASYTLATFRMSYGLFGPTEIRLLLIAGTIRLMHSPMTHIAGREFRLFDVGGAIAIAGMLGMALFATLQHTRQLYREETVR
jgi:archaetidylinositol phosphate synthase